MSRIKLIEPVGYRRFRGMFDPRGSALVLTDSGGVQEEAPAFGAARVLVLREATERPEAVEAGRARLVGTCPKAIVEAAEESLAQPDRVLPYGAVAPNPFGDGWASERIARILAERFGIDAGPLPSRFSMTWAPARPAGC